jgi:palmitoyltransferase ZDHHC9/14/18
MYSFTWLYQVLRGSMGFSRLATVPKIPREKKDIVISKDPLQKNRRYRVYMHSRMYMLKPCRICRVIRPPHTVHCYKCNQWVRDFDHHCVWLSCCIGKGNYEYFWVFLGMLNLLLLLTITQSLIAIFNDNRVEDVKYIGRNLSRNPYSVIIIIYWVVLMGFVLPLFLFHVFLIFKGTSTYIFLKGRERVSYKFILLCVFVKYLPIYTG